MTPDLLTAKEVKEILRVGLCHVYDLARRREILYVRIGGRMLFPRTAVEDFIRANTVSPKRDFFSVNRRVLRNHQPRLRPIGEEPNQVAEDRDNDEFHTCVHEPSLRRA